MLEHLGESTEGAAATETPDGAEGAGEGSAPGGSVAD